MTPRSFSNGNGPNANGNGNTTQSSPATLTMFGVHLGAGDNHWAKLV